ncbi:hypothetical protein [Mesonia sp.]|uniref:hypothetical protein n=1 Tax=Mesonia sp. TaxID=1960830 RepID=UPI00176E3BE2|nr:hypothetical protein [Mesonia sp.]HIB38217.1 hypothetical protein [Mesonia sp.]HIO27969.1 hypothetical protein [Flavobacteriaceae bacterium]
MKTTYNNNAILQEMNNLIRFSCSQSSPKLQKFQEALIKKHFGALEVSNDVNNNEIHLKLMVKKGQYTNVVVQYSSYEDFLKSCLEDDLGNLSFYQNMLTFYNTSAA